MEPITLKINRLGRIHNSEVEVRQLTLFSGNSGLGKSYIAILCHYLFDVLLDKRRINTFFSDCDINISQMKEDNGNLLTVDKHSFEKWLSRDAAKYLDYMLNMDGVACDVDIILPKAVSEIMTVSFRRVGKSLGEGENSDVNTDIILSLSGLQYTYAESSDKGVGGEKPYSFLFRYYLMSCIFGDWKALKNAFVLPPSRGMAMTEDVKPLTGLYQKFDATLSVIDSAKPMKDNTDDDTISLMRQILDGNVRREGDKYVYNTGGKKMLLSAAAASIRELAPCAMMIERTDIKKVALLFEEPEAHLHPLKQRMIADMLVCMHHAGTCMQITTHSDYLLRRINELICLERIRQKKGPDFFNRVASKTKILPQLALSTDKIAAYLLQEDGDDCVIKKQNLDDGIPYSSFREALDNALSNWDSLEAALE